MKEVFKDIPGYESKYQVSNLGNVKSIIFEKERFLKIRPNTHGRACVALYKDKLRKEFQVHVLVALTFIGERPDGYHICHTDGDHLNNKLENLRYDTVSENRKDCYRYNSKGGNGKLFTDEIVKIREMYKSGKYIYKELSLIFKVSEAQISMIVTKRSYSYINDDGTINESETMIS